MKKLTQNDYKKILSYYNISPPNTTVKMKKTAQKILSEKLCRCIKKIPGNEKKNITICTKSIFQRKNLKRGKFSCKTKKRLHLEKNK